MLTFLKRNLFITIVFIFTLSMGFITFLTFIDKSFIPLNEKNLQNLLIADSILLVIFFLIIFIEVKNSFKNNINVRGSIANRKYIIFFSLFTLIPSLLISTFSLFLFSFALDKYFDNKITTAVNNSYELAKNYVDEKRNKVESDVILIAFDLNKNFSIYMNDKKTFQNFLNTQRVLRNIDQIHLINSKKKVLMSSSTTEYLPIENKALEMVLNDDRPLKIINAFENKSGAIIKLSSFTDTYLYIVKFLDEDISKYLTESEEAINFYYTVENQNLGIRISFALIYIIIVAVLLFLAITIAIRFSSRFFVSINNLISASVEIGKGNLNTTVPELKADKEIELLNKNFNSMITRLKSQQEKLLATERHEAWENVARKLAHEIKNPLTPIQLTIDRLKNKYQKNVDDKEQANFEEYLKTIRKQIKQIENLVDEFSDFARMPKPIFKINNIYNIVAENIKLLKEIDSTINFEILSSNKEIYLNSDNEQLNRAFLNLIKNSIESIQEKAKKTPNFVKKIDVEMKEFNDYIDIFIKDNGIGFTENKFSKLARPYFTTKKKGSGLGLSIVSKIINDHNGSIDMSSDNNGALVKIKLFKNGN